MCILLFCLFHFNFLNAQEIKWENYIGDWYNLEYIKLLINSRSPKIAVDKIEHPSISFGINKDNKKYFLLNSNFNDASGNTVEINNDGTISEVVGNKLLKPLAKIEKYNGDYLLILINRFSENDSFNKYIRIKDFKQFINGILLNGLYKNKNDELYLFYNGKGKWNDKIVKYEIGLNYTFIDCDYITIENEKDEYGYPLRYGFEIKSNVLKLYKIKSNEEDINLLCEKKPEYILFKVKSEMPYYDSFPYNNLEKLSKGDLRYLRNEIFARHGYSFNLLEFQLYFGSQNWYKPISKSKININKLNSKERNILRKIIELEKS